MFDIEKITSGLPYVYRGNKALSDEIIKTKRIILLGLSGAGKSTLTNFVRNSDLIRNKDIEIPMRVTTRDPRRDDNPIEICHVSPQNFDGLVDKGNIKLHYINQFDKTGAPKQYGFLEDNAYNIKLYHGGIGLIETADKNNTVNNFINDALIIGVVAGQKIRHNRIINRSPESLKNPIEAQKRLSGTKQLIEKESHIVIDNSYQKELVEASFLTVINRVVSQLKI